MRLRNIKNAKEIIYSSQYFISDPRKYKGKYDNLFPKKQKIKIEIGMGKGDFIIGMAKAFPETNFIGIEKQESILAKAVQKLENENLTNVKVMCNDAIELNEIFSQEINTIYLNFSDPWPKLRHAKRRLTSELLLKVYDDLFIDQKRIKLKTDNDILFASSIESLSKYGYILKKVTLDLHAIDCFNIKTEYEIKFSEMGNKIKYLEAEKE